MFFENAELDPTQHRLEVGCLDTVGEYNTPVRQGDPWPNCTQTGEHLVIIFCFIINTAVLCGAPPEPTVNGSRVWIDLDYSDDSIEVISKRKILLHNIIINKPGRNMPPSLFIRKLSLKPK